jgi:hypothetical protein
MSNFQLALVLAVTMVQFVFAQQPSTSALSSASIEPPSGEKLILEVEAEGVQIYDCAVDNGNPVWRFQGPEAKLKSTSGSPTGTHFAGPTWKLLDGSEVKGSMVSTKPATEPGAVAWLLLRVVGNKGEGQLRTAEYITRTNTKGGVAPATGCDSSHQGEQVRVPYSATYKFYGK